MPCTSNSGLPMLGCCGGGGETHPLCQCEFSVQDYTASIFYSGPARDFGAEVRAHWQSIWSELHQTLTPDWIRSITGVDDIYGRTFVFNKVRGAYDPNFSPPNWIWLGDGIRAFKQPSNVMTRALNNGSLGAFVTVDLVFRPGSRICLRETPDSGPVSYRGMIGRTWDAIYAPALGQCSQVDNFWGVCQSTTVYAPESGCTYPAP
jgi:hypothetical protein